MYIYIYIVIVIVICSNLVVVARQPKHCLRQGLANIA